MQGTASHRLFSRWNRFHLGAAETKINLHISKKNKRNWFLSSPLRKESIHRNHTHSSMSSNLKTDRACQHSEYSIIAAVTWGSGNNMGTIFWEVPGIKTQVRFFPLPFVFRGKLVILTGTRDTYFLRLCYPSTVYFFPFWAEI